MMETGLTYTSTVVVSKENVAATMGSGDLNVFATPAMVALMENAAMSAVADELPEGSTTVAVSYTHLSLFTITAKQILYPQCVAMDHNSPIQNLHI